MVDGLTLFFSGIVVGIGAMALGFFLGGQFISSKKGGAE